MTKIICPISGLPLVVAPYMLGFNLSEKHPIFRMKRRDLITDKFIHRFNRAQSTEEKRLYFLGAIYSTDLVEFHCIAVPSLKTIEDNFDAVCRIARWIDFAYYQGVSKDNPLPRFAVRPENKEMENIKSAWILPIEELRESYSKSERDREKSKRDRGTVEKLFKELNDAFKKDRLFTPYTVDWAIEYCGLENHPKISIYREILLTKANVAWGLDRYLLEELHELFFLEFDHNHPFYSAFMGQINQLTRIQQKGFNDTMSSFEIVEEPESYIDNEGMEQTRTVNTSTLYKEKMIKEYGSNVKPNRNNFASHFHYLKAMAVWKTANPDWREKGDSNV